ncbi:MAG: alpha/beta hydrolase [Ramlibacter sp.]
MLNLRGNTIDCQDTGEGPAVLFLPGSYSTAAAWRPVQRLLGPGLRLVTSSLCGYGGTADTRTQHDFGIAHEVNVVEALARHIGQPVHLVGHSFGGAVALAAALAGNIAMASLSLFEANPLPVIEHHAGGVLYRETLAMSRAFEAAVAAGEPDAPARIIDFWGGAGAFAALPEAVQAYCRQCAPVNVRDWHTAFAMAVRPQDVAALRVPVLLVRGALANPAMVQITETLRAALPGAQHASVEGAGHFLVSTHAAACAALIGSFVSNQPAPVVGQG